MRQFGRHERDGGLSTKAVVEWNGKPVKSVGKGFEAAVKAAGLGADVTPHILRHTCATWLMQSGVDLWNAAGFLGMTVQQLENGYGHHHPDYRASVVKTRLPDHRDRILLRVCREWPRGRRRAAEQRDEVAPPHSITSSARPSSGSGISRLNTALRKGRVNERG